MSSGQNRWQAPTSSPIKAAIELETMSLRSIQVEQSTQKAQIVKERKKSLAQIQAEEAAIKQISDYYASTRLASSNERITIKLVSH